jgi:predicted transcriptional regulator
MRGLSFNAKRKKQMAEQLLEMAKDLVMAMIRSNQISPDDMQKELQNTYASLTALQAKETGGETSGNVAGNAVDWKKSIKKHSVSCLVCGETFKQLSSRHLSAHDLDPKSYRQQFGIPMSQPLSAKATTALRRQVVNETRPWEKAPTFRQSQEAEATPKPPPAAAAKRAGRKKAAARA